MTASALYWLSRDFRFSDNAALTAALGEGLAGVVFLFDRQTREQGAASRWRLEQALRIFDQELQARSGLRVILAEGEAEEVFPRLLQLSGAGRIHQNDWPRPAMQAAQERLRRALGPGAAGRLVLHPGHLLTHPGALRTGEGGVYRVFTPFARALRRLGPDRPLPDLPSRFSPAPCAALSPEGLASGAGLRLRDPACPDFAPDLHKGQALLSRFALPAGEGAAFARLEAFFDKAALYPAGRDRPDEEACSGLSEPLALGEISPRSLWALAQLRVEADSPQGPASAAAAGIEALLTEVNWREFAWHLLISFPEMETMPWRRDWVSFPWQGESDASRDWQRGRSGVALVDAGLREMWVTGRMHNRVRMVVASWLTKHLLTHWRIGLRHFETCLTDWDPASNAMNWQWVAGCGPDASPFFRIFNPETQARKFDPGGVYRARWLGQSEGPREGSGEGQGISAEAAARAASLPASWGADPAPGSGPPIGLAEGRDRALRLYKGFRRDPETVSDTDTTDSNLLNFLRDFHQL